MAKASSQALPGLRVRRLQYEIRDLRVRRLQYEIRAIHEFRTAGDECAWERG